jgi:hypothetical protein
MTPRRRHRALPSMERRRPPTTPDTCHAASGPYARYTGSTTALSTPRRATPRPTTRDHRHEVRFREGAASTRERRLAVKKEARSSRRCPGRDETRRDETYRRRDDDNRMIIITRRISRTTKGATAGCFEALRLAAAAAAQTIPPPLRARPRPPAATSAPRGLTYHLMIRAKACAPRATAPPTVAASSRCCEASRLAATGAADRHRCARMGEVLGATHAPAQGRLAFPGEVLRATAGEVGLEEN